MVAAKDYALQLKLKRDQIVSLMYHPCCSCNQTEPSIPLEGTNLFRPNFESYCRNFFMEDDHQEKSRRIGHVNFSLPMEPNKSFMVECNSEEKKVEPTNAIDASNKETEAAEDKYRRQIVGHQDQTLALTLAESNVVKQSGNSRKLDFDGVSNREEINVLEDLNKNIYLHDGLNKSTIVEGGSDLEIEGFNCMSNFKDGDLLEGMNKTVVDQRGGFEKKETKNPTETDHSVVDGEPSLFQIGGSSSDQAVAMKDLISVGDETNKEVLKVKTILEDWKNQPAMMLLELLMKLERLDLNYKILEDTLIGRTVSDLRKHGSKDIRGAARSLIRCWKIKVNEWIRVNAQVEATEDQLPSGTLNEGDIVSPALAELLQTFEDVNVTEFSSIFQPENTQGNLYFNEELGYAEKELLQITNSGRIDVGEKIREEDFLQQPLPILNLSSISKNKQPRSDEDELGRFDNTKIMEKDSMKNLGGHFPLSKSESMGNWTNKVKNNASEDVITENRVVSSLQVCNDQKLKQTAVAKGRDRKEVRTSESNELEKVEETRTKLQEGFKTVKKRRAIHVVNDNHLYPTKELKCQKNHHSEGEEGRK